MNATVQHLSIIDVYANERHMEKQALVAVLMNTIMPRDREGRPKATMEDLVAFLQLARRFDLDPFAREIYCIMAKGVVRPYISIDGYAKIANREPQYDGVSFSYEQDDHGNFLSVTCTLYRKDRSHPTVITEFMIECNRPDSDAWKTAPSRMLRHRAFIQAVRLAFGISGALDYEEAVLEAIPSEVVSDPPQPALRSPRKPPSPSQLKDQRNDRVEVDTKQAKETVAAEKNGEQGKPESKSVGHDPATGEVFEPEGFLTDLDEALSGAKTAEELDTIWTDFDVGATLTNMSQYLARAGTLKTWHEDRLAKAAKKAKEE